MKKPVHNFIALGRWERGGEGLERCEYERMGREAATYKACGKVGIPAMQEDGYEDVMVISCGMLTGWAKGYP